MNQTKRENIMEARKNIRNLIRLEGQKIAKLTEMDQALEQLLDRPEWGEKEKAAIEEIKRMMP